MTDVVPTERELQALKVLWSEGEATVQTICQAINDAGDHLAYTTVLSLMQVMEQKGLVGHRREGKAYTYFPKIARENTFRKLASGFLENVFDGALDEYMVHVLESHDASVEELDQLAKMIAEAKRRARKKKTRGKRK